MPSPRTRNHALRAALLLAVAAACGGGDGGPAAPENPARELATRWDGQWAGQTAAHELALRLTTGVSRYTCSVRAPGNTTCYSSFVRTTGTYRDRATGEAFALPGLEIQGEPNGDYVMLPLLERPPLPTAYLFRGRLASPSVLSGWLVMHPRCSAVSGCPTGVRTDSAAITLQRR